MWTPHKVRGQRLHQASASWPTAPSSPGPAVERTPELQFQRPDPVVELSPDDARSRGIRNGATVTVSSNGTSVELRAQIARDLEAGAVRIAVDHAADLHPMVEVKA